MICELSQAALELEEKVVLQQWLRVHERVCSDVQKNCAYSLSFVAAEVYVVCTKCKERHKLK